jgi:hypothetical protein
MTLDHKAFPAGIIAPNDSYDALRHRTYVRDKKNRTEAKYMAPICVYPHF